MAYVLSNSEWQNLNQTIYRINTEEDQKSFLFHVMKHINLLCPYSCGVFDLVHTTGSGLKIYESTGVNLLPEDTQNLNQYGLAHNSFLQGVCMIPGGNVSCGFSRDQFTETQQLNFRSTVIPHDPSHTLTIVLYHDTDLLGFILLMRRDEEKPFSDSNICAMDTLRHHIALQLHKILRTTAPETKQEPAKDPLKNIADRFHLTPKENEVLALILQRRSDEEICKDLFITQATLKKHLSHIYHKTAVKSRVALLQLINYHQQA